MNKEEMKDRFTQIDIKIEKTFDLGNQTKKSLTILKEKIESLKQTFSETDKEIIKEAIKEMKKVRAKNKESMSE